MKAKPPVKPPYFFCVKLSHPDPNSGWLAKGRPQRRHSQAPRANLVSHFRSQLTVRETGLCCPEAQRSSEAGVPNAPAASHCPLCCMDHVPLGTLRAGTCSFSIPIPPEDSRAYHTAYKCTIRQRQNIKGTNM